MILCHQQTEFNGDAGYEKAITGRPRRCDVSMGLMEMAQVNEQEHMREALRRAAIREARKQAGVTWVQVVRARLFRSRVVVTPPAVAAVPAPADVRPSPAPAPAASSSAAPSANTRPVLVHEVRIRQHAGTASSSAARASAPAPKLRIVEAAELDCVGADC